MLTVTFHYLVLQINSLDILCILSYARACNYTPPTIVSVFKPSLRIMYWTWCRGNSLYQVNITQLHNLAWCSGSVSIRPCGVWCRGFTTYPLYAGPLLYKAFLLDCKFDMVENNMPLSCMYHRQTTATLEQHLEQHQQIKNRCTNKMTLMIIIINL